MDVVAVLHGHNPAVRRVKLDFFGNEDRIGFEEMRLLRRDGKHIIGGDGLCGATISPNYRWKNFSWPERDIGMIGQVRSLVRQADCNGYPERQAVFKLGGNGCRAEATTQLVVFTGELNPLDVPGVVHTVEV